MALRITCPTCRSSFFVENDVRGQQIRCSSCQKPMLVPSADPPPLPSRGDGPRSSAVRSGARPAPARPAPPARRHLRDDDVDLPPRPRDGKKGDAAETNAAWYLVGGLAAAGVVIAGLIGVFWALSGGSADKNPALVAQDDRRPPRGEVPPPPKKAPVEEAQKDPAPPEEPVGEAVEAMAAKDRERVKKATTYLKVHMPGGGVSQGSGFFAIEPGIVLTNAHVLGMLKPDSRPPRRVQVVCDSGEPNERGFEAQVLGVDRSSDLAVLRVLGNDVPPPLEVKSAKNLSELQKVYVFGFPFGEQLGKNITISESSVSSLRKEPGTDIIQKVQVNGGMQPGNSGGPVVDSRGDVVGVAVAGIRATQINFAVPGDFVKSILNGRVEGMSLAQPYYDGGAVKVEVKLQVLDPLRKVQELAVECWTGNRTGRRLPSKTQPPRLPGDSAPQKLVLRNDGSGQITLPPLPSGQVYWVRPVITNGAGETSWVGAGPYEPLPPMERKPALLVLKGSPGIKPLHLTSTTTIKLVDDQKDHAIAVKMDVNLVEQTAVKGPQLSLINLAYKDARLDITIDGKPLPGSDRMQQYVQGLGLVVAQMAMDRNGNLRKNGVVAPGLPPAMRQKVLDLHEIINEALEVVAVPLPNKKMEANQKWTAVRPMSVVTGEKTDLTLIQMTFTYLGTRTRNGKQEAVIDIAGKLKGGGARELRYGGTADGLALYDLKTGQIAQSRLSVRFDMDEGGANQIRAVGNLDVRLERP